VVSNSTSASTKPKEGGTAKRLVFARIDHESRDKGKKHLVLEGCTNIDSIICGAYQVLPDAKSNYRI